jgi:hypothetical protein
MKTAIVALIAACLFLVAAYAGLGSGAATPYAPQLIAVGGTASDASIPTVGDLPLVMPGTPGALATGPSQIVAVGRLVGPAGSLSDLAASSSGGGGGPTSVAIGQPTGQQPGTQQIFFNTTISPIPAASPQTGVTNPGPGPSPVGTPDAQPSHSPTPQPSPTPSPVVTPTPTPTPIPTPTPPVTVTVTPPVTATVSPGSGVSPSP